jgi:hypothetical protein
MTTHRTVLRLEELGARVLPSSTVPAPTTSTTATVQTTTGSAWSGSGRFTLTTASSTHLKTYALQGSVNFGSAGFLAVSGSVASVGNKAGHASGRVTLSNAHGTLILNVTGASQAANAALPSSFTYQVVSGTGIFAHYSGQGTLHLSPTLFAGYGDRGNFTISATAPTATTTRTPTPTPSTTTLGPSWNGQGRFSISTVSSTRVKSYTLDGTADFGSSGFFAIKGTIQSVGNRSGQATGRITLSGSRGTLVLSVTGATQSANSALPSKLTYRVLSGTGFFAHYTGQGTFQIVNLLWPGYSDKGHFSVAVKPTSK